MMNGNDVDDPAAIASTSSSNTAGATTTTTTASAREDVSASIPNEDAHISEQMQLLEIGQDTLQGLRVYCESDSLTEQGLRERLSHEPTVDSSPYDILLIFICKNDRVTYGMLQFFLQRFPASAGYIDPSGVTPLHFLCHNKNATLNIVSHSNPGALVAQDCLGQTPLIYLCTNEELGDTMSEDILKFILHTCPESAKRCTQQGHLPIEFALVRHSPKFCCLLIEAYPDSVRHEVEGKLVLYGVLFSPNVKDSVALAVLELLLQKYPDMIRDVRFEGRSALNEAATNYLPRAVEICRLLAQAFPGLVLELDESEFGQKQPLHVACLFGNLPVVKCILVMRPDAIRGESSDGRCPIHFAISALIVLTENPQTAVEVVEFLLSVDPSVASQEVNGSFPLIRACARTNDSNLMAGLEVIKSLYDAYPEAIVIAEQTFRQAIDRSEFDEEVAGFLITQFEYAAQANDPRLIITQDEDGNLPIHNALLELAPLGSIKLLTQANPFTLRIPDNEGMLPLHVACERYPDVVKYLVNLNMMSLCVTNDRGDTPLHCACRTANYGVIELLLTQTYPTASVGVRNLNGDLPIQLFLEHDDQESAGYVSCIFLLLRASPGMWMNDANIVLALSSRSTSVI